MKQWLKRLLSKYLPLNPLSIAYFAIIQFKHGILPSSNMITLSVNVLSNTAGEMDDGVVVGKINKTNPTAVLLGESLVSIAQVIRKAVTASGTVLEDFTTAATNSAAGDFAPFGTASDMSAGDAMYWRTLNNIDTHVTYFQIATAGVGTWTLAIQEWNASTEQWEDVTGFNDPSNGLKAGTGVYKMSYTSGAEGSVRLDDTSSKYVWHRLVIKTFTSATTAPVLSRIWSADTAISYQNITATFTTGVWTSLPSEILPRVGDCLQFVLPYKAIGLDTVITLPASTNYTTQWKYLADDNTYKAFSNVADASSTLTVAASTTERKVRWDIPSDWSSKTVKDKDGVSHAGYVVCLQITAVGTEGPVAPPKVSGSSRCFGSSYTSGGVQMFSAITIKAVSIPHIGVPSTSSVTAQLLNLSNGGSSSFTIPANSLTYNVDVTDLSFVANERLGLSVSSGEIRDVEIILQ